MGLEVTIKFEMFLLIGSLPTVLIIAGVAAEYQKLRKSLRQVKSLISKSLIAPKDSHSPGLQLFAGRVHVPKRKRGLADPTG